MDDFLTVYQQTRRMARSFPAETGKKEEKNKKNIKKFLKGGREPRRADCASAHGHGPVPVGHWRGYTQKIPPLGGGSRSETGWFGSLFGNIESVKKARNPSASLRGSMDLFPLDFFSINFRNLAEIREPAGCAKLIFLLK